MSFVALTDRFCLYVLGLILTSQSNETNQSPGSSVLQDCNPTFIENSHIMLSSKSRPTVHVWLYKQDDQLDCSALSPAEFPAELMMFEHHMCK